jgi:dTDP-4-amino-4,6-dideoxygalactose transaminase
MLTGDADLLQAARTWSLHGMTHDAWDRYSLKGSWYYEVVAAGFKYNMSDIQAAIGLHQLRKLNEFQLRRRQIVSRYNAAFSRLEEVETPVERPEVEHAWHLYALRLNFHSLAIDRGPFIDELKARNIGTSVHFIPIHLHPYYREKYGFHPDDFPIASREHERLVSLPLYPRMTDADVDDVIEAVTDVVTRYRR